MSFHLNQRIESYLYWDASGNGRALAAYQPVSLADATEVAAAVAAGMHQAVIGRVVVPTPVSGGFATRRVTGISTASARNTKEIAVAVEGVAEVMTNAAVAVDARVFAVAAEARSSAQTPFTNLPMINLPVDPSFTVSYNLSLADDPAVTIATSGANTLYNPIGYALEAATAKYDVIAVRLELAPFYA
jgi:hypothetical protein